ncbi:MAG: hypothetical protein V1717_04510 [Candidatus Micrarchaeota archaeon]
MSVQGEYESLISRVVSLERIGVPAAKMALTEILDERYGGAPNALRYRAFTQLSGDDVEKAKKYLRVYLGSTRFRNDFKELAWLIFGK